MGTVLKRRNLYSSFNGTTSYLQYADNDIFSFTDGVNDLPFSIEFDLLTKNISSYQYLISKAFVNGINREWSINLTGGQLHVILFVSEAIVANYLRVYTTASININTFYKYKITYDGSKTVAGIKVYINGVSQTLNSSLSIGTYTGMTNTSREVLVGHTGYATTYYLNGYLRNLKITKNNQLVFHATLQDSLAIGKDIISGLSPTTATAVSVVDINEGGNWSLFNGTSSKLVFADNDIFSLIDGVNDAVCVWEFEFYNNSVSTLQQLCIKGIGSTAEWEILLTGSKLNLYIETYNPTFVGYIGISSPTLTNGTVYQVRITYDASKTVGGFKMYFNNVLQTTTTLTLGTYTGMIAGTQQFFIGMLSAARPFNGGIRNFKLTKSGTVIFSLPLQSKDDLMIDRVSGLVGTQTDVKIINNNTNVLKSQNKWAYFNGTTSQIQVADNDIFSMTNGINDLSFSVEFDIINLYTGNQARTIIGKRNSVGTGEWDVDILSTKQIAIVLVNNNNTSAYIQVRSTNSLIYNTPYNIKVTYDGSGLWTGIKIYINKLQEITVNLSSGVYVGMINTTALLYVCRDAYDSSVLNGYVRNIKITKANQLVFHLPLQDSLNIGKDIIGGLNGTVTNVSVVNQIETQNWASFNGINSVASIGTTSTLGWMNTGVFNMEFTIKVLTHTLGKYVISTGSNSASYGFMVFMNTSVMTIYWSKGGGGYGGQANILNAVLGTEYRVIIKGDGSKLYFTTYNSDGSVYLTNEPAGVACTYVPNATTTYTLSLGSVSNLSTNVFNSNIQLRNFKIYQDFAGTIPFMSLPIQDAPTLMTDRITGLQGTATNVSIVNNNQNVLRSKNLWMQFNTLAASYIDVGTTSTVRFINDTGIFRIEFEYIPSNKATQYILYTSYTKGFDVLSTASNSITFRMNNSIGGYLCNFTNSIVVGMYYKVIYYGDGVNIYCSLNGTTTSVAYSGSFNVGATVIPLRLGTHTANYNISNIRNLIIYQSSDRSRPVLSLPLTDSLNMGKDVVGGLQGTVTNVTVVERPEQRWTYFNGTSAFGQIGTTSTLGWMNSGVFNMEFEIRMLRSTGTNPIFVTAYSTTQYGITFFNAASNYFTLFVCKATAGFTAISITASNPTVIGATYRVIIKANGSQTQLIIYNSDTGSLFYDSGLQATVYVPNSTTGIIPTIANYMTVYGNIQIRNIKIYTDFAGTLPFMSLPMQDRDDIMVDRVTGLVGTQTDVKIITEY